MLFLCLLGMSHCFNHQFPNDHNRFDSQVTTEKVQTPIQTNETIDSASDHFQSDGLTFKQDITIRQDDYYSGSVTCIQCHSSIYQRWKDTPHAHHFDETYQSPPHIGRCSACHITGVSETAVGCESCHGPSGTHSKAPTSSITPRCRVCEIRKQCIRCHTRAIDPDFQFPAALRKVDHGKHQTD